MISTSTLFLFITIPRLLAILDVGKYWNLCFRVTSGLKCLGISVSISVPATYVCGPS